MAAEDKAVQIEEEPGCFRLDLETEYGWKSVIRHDGSQKILKFKSIEAALITRRLMGLPMNKIRIIDENRGRRVKLEND